MSNNIIIFDTTLRDGEQTPNVNLNVHEKVEIARLLDKMGVDVIEAGFAIASVGDFEAIKAVSNEVKNCIVASLSRSVEKDIDRAWEAVKDAKRSRIHTFIATSDIHMKYKLKMTPEEVLNKAGYMVAYAKKYCEDIEFSAEDATRTEPDFLCRVLEEVIKKGATTLNIPDTVGYTDPEEFSNLIKYVVNNTKGIEKTIISVHCHNDLGLGVANSLAAVKAGARQIECTINGLGERAGNAAMEEIIMGLNTRRDLYNINHNIDSTQIYRTSKLVSSLTGVLVQPNKAIVGANAFAHESGIHQHGVLAESTTYEIMTPESIGLKNNVMVLGKLSGRHAFEDRLKEMGYSLSDDEIKEAFAKFKSLADKKKHISSRDIEAIIEEKLFDIENTYELERFQINSGNQLIATAVVSLKKGEETFTEAATGDGPVDAAFNALELVSGLSLKLDDYHINAVTEGKDALGEVTVRVKYMDKPYTGRGVSTDVIEASVMAYLNTINKVLLENDLNPTKSK